MSMQMNHCQAIKQKLPHSATENPRKVQSNFFLCEYANEHAKGYANETPKKNSYLSSIASVPPVWTTDSTVYLQLIKIHGLINI